MNTEIPTLTIRLHSSDNVVVARIDLAAGTAIPSEGLTTCLHVPAGHKVATVAIHSGQPVKKYSQLIGLATSDILPGEWVHSHNMALKTYPREYSVGAGANPIDYIPEKSRATFNGIVRPDGRIPHSLSSFLLPWWSYQNSERYEKSPKRVGGFLN